MLKFEKLLNKLSSEIGVGRISDYYDNSILAEEFGEEVEPKLSDPVLLELIFSALISAIKEGKSKKLKDNPHIIEELEDCLSKVIEAKHKKENVRIAIVP